MKTFEITYLKKCGNIKNITLLSKSKEQAILKFESIFNIEPIININEL